MANQAYGFGMNVSATTDEEGAGIAYAYSTFVVLDENSHVVQSQGGSDAITIETLLQRGDASSALRDRIVAALRNVMQDQTLAVEWVDEA